MCGIVGCTAYEDCLEFLLSGLERLEYRGYDSAGVAVMDGGAIKVTKTKGRLSALEKLLERFPVSGNTGIGHTRWATHGEPNRENSHPHMDNSGGVAVVHNGIIENYYSLKRMLEAKGVAFSTQTDTEVVAQLLGYYYDGDMLETMRRVLPLLEGSYALAVMDARMPGTIYCTKKGSPLVAGHGIQRSVIASDIPAMLSCTRDIYIMEDLEIGVLTPERIAFYDELGNPVEKRSVRVDWDVEAAEKGGYAHFMLKEISEQPQVLRDTFNHYVDLNARNWRDWGFVPEGDPRLLQHITILACGTAYHAGMVGRALIEKLAKIRVDVEIASEFRYSEAPINEGELFLIISQSGETADTIAAMRRAREAGCPTIALCNVIGSTIAREADAVMYTLAGPEIAVASTKAYTTQLLLLELLALRLSQARGVLSEDALWSLLNELATIPDKAQALVEAKQEIQCFAASQAAVKNVFFIGRGLDYCLALEAALKLKEISYLHAEAYAAGELKHGTIALIEEGSLVIAMATQPRVFDKMLSNIEEVRVRGARVLALSGADSAELKSLCACWRIPETQAIFAPLLSIIPMQLFAYYMALGRGCDIDKPRNLAKSVTVE